jgi:23S rRNA G2445 N2-methylase RlmL
MEDMKNRENPFIEKLHRLYKERKKIRLTADEIHQAVSLLDVEDMKFRFYIGELILHQGKKSTPALLEGSRDRKDEIRRSAVFLLGKSMAGQKGRPPRDVMEAFHRTLLDQDPKVRKNSAIALGNLKQSSSVKELIRALEQEPFEWVRPSMILAIGAIGGEEALTCLSGYPARSEEEKQALHKALERNRKPEKGLIFKDRLPHPVPIELWTFSGLEEVLDKEAEEAGFSHRELDGRLIRLESTEPKRLFSLRTFSECLFPVGGIRGVEWSRAPESIVDLFRERDLMAQIASFHEGQAPGISYRLELRGKNLRHALRKKIITETARLLASEYPHWINSPSRYDIEFRIMLEADRIRLYWKAFTIEDERFSYRAADVPASIHPVAAAGIIRMMPLSTGEAVRVLDPFCGSGTLLVEREKRSPCRELVGVDITSRAIEAARRNLNAAGLKHTRLIRDDMANLLRHELEKFDEIITNLPFGIRVGKHDENQVLYRKFFNLAPSLLKEGGIMLLFSQEIRLIRELLSDNPHFRLLKSQKIQTGGLNPEAFIIRRI